MSTNLVALLRLTNRVLLIIERIKVFKDRLKGRIGGIEERKDSFEEGWILDNHIRMDILQAAVALKNEKNL